VKATPSSLESLAQTVCEVEPSDEASLLPSRQLHGPG
jgi:hypothetical protein